MLVILELPDFDEELCVLAKMDKDIENLVKSFKNNALAVNLPPISFPP